MANQVNQCWANTNTDDGVVLDNLFATGVAPATTRANLINGAGWTGSASGGGVAPVEFERLAEFDVLVSDGGSKMVRSDVTLAPGRYIFTVETTVKAGTIDKNNISVDAVTGSFVGTAFYTVDALAVISVIFDVTSSSTPNFKFGLGARTSNQTFGTSCTMGNASLYKIPATSEVPPFFVQDVGVAPFANSSSWASGTGIVTVTEGNSLFKPNRYQLGIYVSDSFGVGSLDEWPQLLCEQSGEFALLGNAVDSRDMTDSALITSDLFSLDSYVEERMQPQFAIIQSSINSAADTAAVKLTAMGGMIDDALTNNLVPIVLNLTPSNITDASRKSFRAEYNAELQAFCEAKGAVHVDVATPVTNPSNTEQLLAIFDLDNGDGTGTHLNRDGANAYISPILKKLDELRTGSAALSVVRGVVRR